MLKVRRLRNHLIFNMGIFILIRWHFCIETTPCSPWMIEQDLSQKHKGRDLFANAPWRSGSLVTWFCYHLITKPGNKVATPSWPDPYPLPSLTENWINHKNKIDCPRPQRVKRALCVRKEGLSKLIGRYPGENSVWQSWQPSLCVCIIAESLQGKWNASIWNIRYRFS